MAKPQPSHADPCYLIQPIDNSTIFLNINPYGGIPENLFINLIGLMVILPMFLILHKYQQLAKIFRKDDHEEWAQRMFFNFTSTMLNPLLITKGNKNYGVNVVLN